MSNEKQIGLGLLQYIQDYDERTPPYAEASTNGGNAPNFGRVSAVSNLLREIYPYTKSVQIYACPSAVPASGGSAPTPPIAAGDLPSDTSYYGNAVYMGINIAVIPNSADLVILHEAQQRYGIFLMRPLKTTYGYYRYWHYYTGGMETYDNMHFDGGNLLFADGHVKFRLYKSLHSSDFGIVDLSGNDVTWSTTNSTSPLDYKRAF